MIAKYKLLVGIVAALAFAQGASAISIDLSNPTIDLSGGQITEDITISGLTAAGQAVSGYDLFLNYDDTSLQFNGNNQPTAPFYDPSDLSQLPTFSFVTIGNGSLELFLVSLNSDADLLALQGDSVDLGQVTFTPNPGLTGTSTVSLDLANSQVTGLEDGGCPNGGTSCPFPDLLQFSNNTGGGGGTSVPEPSPLALAGLGILGLFAAVRMRRQQASLR